MTDTTPEASAEEYWETFYGERDQVWSGAPNPTLVREVTELAPGTALELGCGEGGDAIWLAQQGWAVTAVDVSMTAMARAEAHAVAAGVAGRIDWQQHDLGSSFPTGRFDLVTTHYLHSPVEFGWAEVLKLAAGAVAAGGTLLIVLHANLPAWAAAHAHPHVSFPTGPEIREALGLHAPAWTVERLDDVERVVMSPNGDEITRTDLLLRARRAAG
jgi:SAM-dependent methyltransferase